jgi:hypothetical protein
MAVLDHPVGDDLAAGDVEHLRSPSVPSASDDRLVGDDPNGLPGDPARPSGR